MNQTLLPCPMCGEELIHRVEHFNDPESNDLHTAYCHCGFCFSDDSNSNDEFIELCNRRATNWTPCAEGLPEESARYKVTVQVGSEAGSWSETMIIPYRIYDSVGEWILPKSDWLIYGVLAWTKADEPWTGDQFREPTKMMDHIGDVNKKISDPLTGEKKGENES